jgi:hypothetical protein
MNGESDVEVEDVLRARLRTLDRIAITPYSALRGRAVRRPSSPGAFVLAAAAIVLIVLGAVVGERLRESRSMTPGSAVASGDCGARTSQLDASGHLVGVAKDSTTILIRPLSDVRSETETWFDWYMTGTGVLAVYAESADGSRIAATYNEPTGQDSFLVRLALPTAGCWQLHSERSGGKLSGDVWLHVLSPGAAAPSPNYANLDCSATSARDVAGRVIGTTRDSTAILVTMPADVRADTELTFNWEMTAGSLEASPLTVYAQFGDGLRITPNVIERIGPDDFIVRLVFPKPGCWRLHSERIGGKLSGDLWIQIFSPR